MNIIKARNDVYKAFALMAGILFTGCCLAMPAGTDIVVMKSRTNEAVDTSVNASPHQFQTVNQAVAYVESQAQQQGKIWTIFVKEGTYRERVVIAVDNLRIVGESRDATTIVFNRHAGQKVSDGSEE